MTGLLTKPVKRTTDLVATSQKHMYKMFY